MKEVWEERRTDGRITTKSRKNAIMRSIIIGVGSTQKPPITCVQESFLPNRKILGQQFLELLQMKEIRKEGNIERLY